MTTDSPTLAPCPFCGGEGATFPPTARATDPYDPSDRLFPEARCKRCYATALGENGDFSCKTAIAAWNRRPDRSPAGEVRVETVARAMWEANCPDVTFDEALKGERQGVKADADALDYMRELAEAAISALSPAPAPEREGLLVEALRRIVNDLPEFDYVQRHPDNPTDFRQPGSPYDRGKQAEHERLSRIARAALAAYEEGKDG